MQIVSFRSVEGSGVVIRFEKVRQLLYRIFQLLCSMHVF